MVVTINGNFKQYSRPLEVFNLKTLLEKLVYIATFNYEFRIPIFWKIYKYMKIFYTISR